MMLSAKPKQQSQHPRPCCACVFAALLCLCASMARDDSLRTSSTDCLCFVQTKIKCWLFFSYVVAFAAVAGGVAVLVACVNRHHNLAIGIVRTFCSCSVACRQFCHDNV